MRIARAKFAAILTIVLATLLLLGAWPAAAQVPVADQAKLMYEAMDEVMAKVPKAVREKTIGVGAGSWLTGRTNKLSDIDFTLGNTDPAVEKRLVAKINENINKKWAARYGGKAPHAINVIGHHDPKFAEKFRGETGQIFFKEYATKTGGGNAAVRWGPVEGVGDAAKAVRQSAPTESFWKVLDGHVPKEFTNPHLFMEDSLTMLAAQRGKDGLARGLKAAKYMNNVDNTLIPGLEGYWDIKMTGLKLDPNQAKLRDLLLEIKPRSQAEQMELLKIHFGTDSDKEVMKHLDDFADMAERRFTGMREELAFMDGLHQAGKLKKVGGQSGARAMFEKMGSLFAKHGLKALTALDALAIINAYYDSGPQGAMLEAGATAVSYGCPPAALAAMVAEIGRQVFKATATWAANALIFEPINEMALKAMYRPDNSCYIFGSDIVRSPFAGLTRETLSYRFDYTKPQTVRAAVNAYLGRAKGICAWYTTEGAGQAGPMLQGRMMADLYVSGQIGSEVAEMGPKLLAGTYLPPTRPFRVWLDDAPVLPGSVAKKGKKAAPNAPAVFTIRLAREYGRWQHLKPKGPRLYDVWGKEGGYEAVQRYVKANWLDEYLTGSAPERCEVWVKDARGWRLSGAMPVALPQPGKGGRAKAGDVFYLSNYQHHQWVYRTWRLALSPGPEAAGTALAKVRLVLKSDMPGAQPQFYDMVLGAKAVPAKAKGTAPVIKVECGHCRRGMRGRARVVVGVTGGKSPYAVEYRILALSGTRVESKRVVLSGKGGNLYWSGRAPAPGEYLWQVRAVDAKGVRSDWAEARVTVLKEPKRAQQPKLVANSRAGKKGPCKWSTVATFDGSIKETDTIVPDDKHWPSAATHTVTLPGPGTLRVTLGVSGKHEYANHEYGGCRWRSRAVLSSNVVKGWVAGGMYYPGVRDYDENSYSWKVKGAGKVAITVKPEMCSAYKWRSKGKVHKGCGCYMSHKIGYKALGSNYKLKVEFKPCH